LLQKVDAFRRPERFEQFLLACEADARGRTGFENEPYRQAEYLRNAFDCARRVSLEKEATHSLSGRAIGELVQKARLHAIEDFRKTNGQIPKK
jgi:tRNA nucleotidyltransferase (CCA-adding enzyme)